MKKYSFISVIAIVLLVPTIHSMELRELITPGSFTKEGKEYMDYSVDLWVNAAKEGKVSTGLATIFSIIKTSGINHLIQDPVALEKANMGLDVMLASPVFKTIYDLQKIGDFGYEGAKQLRSDISRVVTQAVAMDVLTSMCPGFKVPSHNLLGFFASFGDASIPDSIKVLKLNDKLDFANNAPYIEALVLIMGYLAQTGTGR